MVSIRRDLVLLLLALCVVPDAQPTRVHAEDRILRERPRLFQRARHLDSISQKQVEIDGAQEIVEIPLPVDRVAKSREKWQKEIDSLISKNTNGETPSNPIVFVGSSSIRMWDLKKSFADLATVNCGFGGSEIFDSVVFAPDLIVPLKPKAIVFYAGDNDIGNGKSPAQVLDDYQLFVARVRTELPCVPILFVSIKPSIKRWEQYDKMKEANGLVESYSKQNSHLYFVDIATVTLGTDGKPKHAFFAEDGLHLSATGYDAWSKVVRSVLTQHNLD